MEALGMLALGTFVGSVIATGIRKTQDWSDLQKVLTTLISAALAGGVFTFLEYLGGNALGKALFLYPVGLLLGLAWLSAETAVANVQGANGPARVAGWLHIVGLVVITLLAVLTLLSSRFRGLLP